MKVNMYMRTGGGRMSSMLLICCVVCVIVLVGVILGCIIQISRGKSIDSSVKTLSQANKAIKAAQEFVYRQTGMWVNNYLELKAYLKRNGLIPFNSKTTITSDKRDNDKHEYKSLADYCREKKIPTPSYGPDINFFEGDKFCQDVKGVVKRLLAMHAVSITVQAFALNGDVEQAKSISRTIINKKGIEDSLTDREKDFLNSPTKELAIGLSWQTESCFALAWAIGICDEISPFYQLTGKEMQMQLEFLLAHKTIDEIVDKIKLRSEKELVFCANVYYCCLWAVRQGELSSKIKLPKGINPETVQERYLSLAWILSNNADEQSGEEPKRYDWDETPLDT